MPYPDERSSSAQLYERACRVLPGGDTRHSVRLDPYPVYAASGEGAWVTDVDGIRRLDLGNNYTSLIHGHAHPAIVCAVAEQLRKGSCFGMPTSAEVALAEILCDRVPGLERIRFTNSGTEGVMMAIKAARAYTGRTMVAKIEGAYHGAYDVVEVSLAPSPDQWGEPDPIPVGFASTPATTVHDVVPLPFNNAAATTRMIEAHADRLAAVIVDVLPRRAGFISAAAEWVAAVREVTRRHGIVLIDDEVITFRLGYHGAMAAFGVTPDLTVLGKIMGGGFPVGAVGGDAAIMSVFDASKGAPLVPHSGTFNANSMTMVAGAAAMQLWTPDAVDALNRAGDSLRSRLGEVLGARGQVTGRGSLFALHLKTTPMSDFRSAYQTPEEAAGVRALNLALLNAGFVLAGGGTGALSTVMSEQDLDDFVASFAEVIDTTATAAAR
jgi:glutamate-1-semialdehyde 2,1-aminomutase